MENKELIGACGFYCKSCPSFVEGKCAGCRREHREGDCFTLDCVTRKGIEFCGTCENFPCDDIISREKVTILDKDWLKWKRKQKEK
ncbi:MAG: DUF3795 domain-containing protein [Oscillospiraceae bacterium]